MARRAWRRWSRERCRMTGNHQRGPNSTKTTPALLGRVTLAWNDCHYMVLWIYPHPVRRKLGKGVRYVLRAERRTDNRRGITLTRMKEALNTKNDQDLLLEKGDGTTGQPCTNLAVEAEFGDPHDVGERANTVRCGRQGRPKMKLGRIRPCRGPKTSKRTSSLNLQV